MSSGSQTNFKESYIYCTKTKQVFLGPQKNLLGFCAVSRELRGMDIFSGETTVRLPCFTSEEGPALKGPYSFLLGWTPFQDDFDM